MMRSIALSAFLCLAGCAAASASTVYQETVESVVLQGCNIPLRYTRAARAERSTFAYDAHAPLELVITPESRLSGLTINQITFRSGRGGKATGFLVVPDGRGPFPAVIVQHGLPGSARDAIGDVGMASVHGAMLLAINAQWNNRSGGVLHFTAQDSAEQVRLIVDIRRAVDYLVSRPDVDRNRIAYWGVSYGGAMGALVAGVEPRFKTLILTVGDGGLVNHFTGPEDTKSIIGQRACQAKRAWNKTPI